MQKNDFIRSFKQITNQQFIFMKKHLLGVCFLALVSALPAFADYSSLSDFWYTAEKKNDGSFFFEVEPPKGSTQNNVLICLEISRYSDFMFIDKSFPMK